MIARRASSSWSSSVDLATVKQHCRVVHDEEDALLSGMIHAAHERAEMETGIAYGAAEWVLETTSSCDTTFPVWPINEIISVEREGTAFAGYTLVRTSRGNALSIQDWPGDLVIRVNAGGPMPETVRQAILMMVAHWYDQRSAVSEANVQEVPLAVSALLGLHRRMFV